MALSEAAADLLRDLVNDHRKGVERGDIVYGTAEDNQEILEILEELAELAETRQVAP